MDSPYSKRSRIICNEHSKHKNSKNKVQNVQFIVSI
jgi:hypothetical protein